MAHILAVDGNVLADSGNVFYVDSFFTIRVKTDNTGTSNNDQFTLPAIGTYNVCWGDGTQESSLTGTQTHTYPAAGTYTVEVCGLSGINFNGGGDCLKVTELMSWSDSPLSSLANGFYGCANMVALFLDSPNFNTASLAQMFRGCSVFNQDLNSWNTGNVGTMSSMFLGALLFNGNITSWNTSAATTLRRMLRGAVRFNQDIGAWNTENVTDFQEVLFSATDFNYPLGGWNILKATTMQDVLINCGMSVENYSKTLIGWGNQAATNLRPFGIPMGAGGLKYSATVYTGSPYDNAVDARAFLTSSREATVSGAIDTDANGAYTIVGGIYTNVNGWYFAFAADVWKLFDGLDVEQASGTGGYSSTPATVTLWAGTESGITAANTGGAGWTITDAGEEI